MSRHSLIASLLPAAYRDQVLGDLEERGFRASDAITAIPAAWWSHLHRGPRYLLSAASDAVLRQRAEQLFRRSSWLFAVWIFIQLQSVIRLINGPLAVGLVIEAILLAVILTARYKSLHFLEPLATAERRKWIEVHRRHLVTQRIWAKLGLPYLLFPLAAMSSVVSFAPGATTRTQRLSWFLSAFTISLIIGHFRARRLKQELEGLQ